MTERTERPPTRPPSAGRTDPESGPEDAALEAELAHWRERLGDAPVGLELPLDRPRRAGRPHRPARHAWTLDAPLVEALDGFCHGEGVSRAAVLTAVLQILLRRVARQTDVVVGVALPGGPGGPGGPAQHAGGEAASFDVLPLRADLAGRPGVREILHRVRDGLRELEAHRAVALPRILAELGLARDGGAHPLFQVGFAYTASPGAASLARAALASLESGALDLSLGVAESDEGTTAALDYDGALFEAATIERMAGHLEVLLRGMIADPERPADRLALLTPQEEEQILRTWNDTRSAFPDDRCLHQLFEAHVAARPDAAAIVEASGALGDATVTYAELDARANRLAHHLRALGVGRETRVGLCVERSADMVIGIVGILKAGGAYVPIDPEYPGARVDFMLADSKVSVLVTQERLAGDLADSSAGRTARLVLLDGERDAIAARPATDPASGVTPDGLAYVIYTSGSTGRPKGIALRHQGVVNNLTDLNESFGVGPSDRVIAISSLGFDMCVYEVLGALAAGAAIVVPDAGAARDPASLAEIVVRQRVTVWNSAPALLEMYVDYVEGRPELCPPALRLAIQGGDWEPVTLPDRLAALAPGVQVVVLGGATEASIHSIVYPVEATDPDWRSIPYGRPMRNQRAYVLDAELQPVPIGVPGEIFLAGTGLARGYFERPGLTAERFLPDPFHDPGHGPGERMYRTGDLARWKADGNIELLGRIDHQVKIRGHRIELGEITAVLRDHADVQDAVVTSIADATPPLQRLVAYVVPARDGAHGGSGDGGGDSRERTAEHVEQWQKVYDDTYGRTPSEQDVTRNFVGWHSSYTGLPFAEEELLELQSGTVDAIRALRPDRVLEIGCGTGLILFPIAPDCSRYDGIDVSPVVVRNLEEAVRRSGQEHVRLWQGSADDLTGVEEKAYDTVVINSVSQHFPSIEYFVRVLEGAVKTVAPGGAIFVGDVRGRHHLETFCSALELHNAPPGLTASHLRQRVEKRLSQEKELFVDPAFFGAVGRHLPGVARVSVRLKRGRHHNEMTKFHYDVVLHVAGAATPGDAAPGSAGIAWRDWRESGASVAAVRRMLEGGATDPVGFTGVPNARVLPEVEARDRLARADAAEVFDATSRAGAESGVDPEDLWALAEELPWTVEVSWCADDERCFDVLLRPRAPGDASDIGGAHGPPPAFRIEAGAPQPWSRYANDPLHASSAARLVPTLRQHLRERLPKYMVPSAFVVLESLPLSPNGKVDRNALPAPDPLRQESDADFVGPRTPVEEVLGSIWSEMLGLDRVGVDDDFFELGGHSLTAAKVVTRAREAFQIEIPLRTLFERPTIAGWAQSVVAAGEAAQTDVAAIAEALIELGQLSEEEVRARLDAETNGS